MGLLNTLINELKVSTENAILADYMDSGDVGNLLGYIIGKQLDKDELMSFIYGIQSGISMVNGSHDSNEVDYLRIHVEIDNAGKRKRATERLKLLNFGE